MSSFFLIGTDSTLEDCLFQFLSIGLFFSFCGIRLGWNIIWLLLWSWKVFAGGLSFGDGFGLFSFFESGFGGFFSQDSVISVALIFQLILVTLDTFLLISASFQYFLLEGSSLCLWKLLLFCRAVSAFNFTKKYLFFINIKLTLIKGVGKNWYFHFATVYIRRCSFTLYLWFSIYHSFIILMVIICINNLLCTCWISGRTPLSSAFLVAKLIFSRLLSINSRRLPRLPAMWRIPRIPFALIW